MSSPSPAPKPPLLSSVFHWDKLNVFPTRTGERRDFFDASTVACRNLECHVTILNAGETSHPPHQHPEEEMIILKDGTLEVTINGQAHQATAGSLFFFAPHDLHGMRNAGTDQAAYYVIRMIAHA